jgi:hypothetical protein
MTEVFRNPILQQAFWSGIVQLGVLAVVAVIGNFVYRRIRDRSLGRRDLMKDIHEFTIQLYKPRKLYQLCNRRDDSGFAQEATLGDSQHRAELRVRMLEDLVGVIGQFRSIQARIVSLFGHDRQLFGYYLAIWAHLKEIRDRMEAGTPLVDDSHPVSSVDPLYRLFDEFRYHVGVKRYALAGRKRLWPSDQELAAMQTEATKVYDRFFNAGRGQYASHVSRIDAEVPRGSIRSQLSGEAPNFD